MTVLLTIFSSIYLRLLDPQIHGVRARMTWFYVMNIWISKIFIMLVCLILNNLIWHSQEMNLEGMTTPGSLTSVLFCACCWSYLVLLGFTLTSDNTARDIEALCFLRCENCSQTFWGMCYFLQKNIKGGKQQTFVYSM